MAYVRNSVLRARGERPSQILAARARARTAEARLNVAMAIAAKNTAVLSNIADTVAGVKTPNGTTKKIARMLEGVA